MNVDQHAHFTGRQHLQELHTLNQCLAPIREGHGAAVLAGVRPLHREAGTVQLSAVVDFKAVGEEVGCRTEPEVQGIQPQRVVHPEQAVVVHEHTLRRLPVCKVRSGQAER